MRLLTSFTLAVLLLSLSMSVGAELQSVQVDGKLTIGGNWFDLDSENLSWIEQRTLLGVNADFTDEVSAYIQFDNYSIWGEDFRSDDWESGVDSRATIDRDYNAEVEVYQAYLQASDMWGYPVRLRLGRQELVYGVEWLIGNNDNGWGAYGLSFDALRVDYFHDVFSLSAVVSKLNETVSGDLFENDINMYMLYGSYIGIEDVEIDGYFIYVDDDTDTTIVLPKALIGSIGGNAYTFGIRVGGIKGPVDFELDLAYQEQDPNDAEYPDNKQGFMALDDDGFAAIHLELGYNWAYACVPRVFAGVAWYEGNEYGGAFNRLFSDIRYTQFHDDQHRNLSNIIIGWIGVEAKPRENIHTGLKLSYFEIDEAGGEWHFPYPVKQPGAPVWSEHPDELGWELEASITYDYSEDLAFSLIYAHFFGDDAMDDEDLDYLGLTSTISF